MIENIDVWINKVKNSEVAIEYENAAIFNIDIKYCSNISSNIREGWYKLGVKYLPSIYEDLYLLSLVVFAVDKRIPRSLFSDSWTRTMYVNVPVINIAIWNDVRHEVNQMLSYLSGDEWYLEFREAESDSRYKSPRKRSPQRPDYLDNVKAVSLFSGGLDSFCGAYKLLSEHTPTLFVGFQEYGQLKGLQQSLVDTLNNEFNERRSELFSFSARALAPYGEFNLKTENTSRSRSFLFLCSAITVAEIVGKDVPVYIPENGFIGLNLPMTASRIGSCSTRTTHPYFLKMFNSLLIRIGVSHKIINPYAFYTKREMVNELKDVPSFRNNIYKTISCSHPCNGRWRGYQVPKNCGYCYPCLIRQSSLLDVDATDDEYGEDVFSENYIKLTTNAMHSDLVDLLSSIVSAKNSTDMNLKRRISATGRLTADEVDKFLRLYKSTIDDLSEMLVKSDQYSKLIGK